MLFQGILTSTLLVVGGVQATYHEAPQGTVKVHEVQVGKDGKLTYWPEKVTAEVGDMVQFTFHPKNHTVTQSDFEHPCLPINQFVSNVTGIKSGFMPVAAGAQNLPVFTVPITDKKPIWVYCGQKGHCQQGMAMVINENAASGKTLEAYKAKAKADGGAPPASGTSNGGVAPTATPPAGTPTKSGPALATTNAAPKQVANAAGLTGLLLAAFAFMGL